MEEKKKQINELVKKLDEMVQKGEKKEEIKEVMEKLNQLLKEYLEQYNK